MIKPNSAINQTKFQNIKFNLFLKTVIDMRRQWLIKSKKAKVKK